MQERGLRSDQQNARAQNAADDAGEKQRREEAARVGSESVAIRYRAREGAGKKRGGVGGVGGDGRHAGEKQRGEGNETAAAGDGVDGAAQGAGEKQKNGVV